MLSQFRSYFMCFPVHCDIVIVLCDALGTVMLGGEGRTKCLSYTLSACLPKLFVNTEYLKINAMQCEVVQSRVQLGILCDTVS
jgi:hypothetical protein